MFFAGHFQNLYTIAIYNADDGLVSPVYTYGIEGSIKNLMSNTTYRDLVIAIMRYGDAVSAL